MMKELYEGMLQRLEYLESQKKSEYNGGRITELQLAIVAVQQLMLDDLNSPYNGLDAEQHNEKMFKMFGQPEGNPKMYIKNLSSFLIDAGKPDIDTNLTLTEKQIEALLLLDEEKSIGLNSCKVSGRVISNLSSKKLVNLENYANGEFWKMTDKGIEVIRLLKSFKKFLNEKTHNKTT